MRQAIHAFKYSGQTSLAEPLGHVLESYWVENVLPADVIVPVPLHSSRLRERGYNQSALLARRLADAVKLPVVEDCLARIRPTASQTNLGGCERKMNVDGAFRCMDERLAGRHVLLIDDVCTTGFTLASCGAALLRSKAASTWGLTLARAL